MKILTKDQKGQTDHHIDFRLLEQRSRLEFNYPRDAAAGDAFVAVFLPFYENPIISESKSANYAEYDILGRSSSLFAYTSSKARKFKVDLQYTLPHLLQMDMTQSRFKNYFTTTEDAKNEFFDIGKPTTVSQTQAQKLFEEYSQVFADVNDASKLLFSVEEFPPQTIKCIDTLLFFVNVLRSSVYNNAVNPLQGPPLVRLTHGSMYQSIPCIVRNYDISVDEQAGYHVETLTPNRIKVSIELNEVRAGNFGYFEKATGVSRDNLAGWESVIGEPYSIDSGVL